MLRFLRILLLGCAVATQAKAQGKLAQSILQAEAEGRVFTSYVPFSLKSGLDTHLTTAVASGQALELNPSVLEQINQQAPAYLRLAIPSSQGIVWLKLQRVQIAAEGFHLDTPLQRNVSVNLGLHYRGVIANEAQSIATFSFFNDRCAGVFASPSIGNSNVVATPTVGAQMYLLYRESELKSPLTFACQDVSRPITTSVHEQTPPSGKCVSLYFEIDYNLFVQNNSNTDTTAQWMAAVFNNVQALYANDNIATAMKSMFIWTTPDPYEGVGTSSSDYLYAFHETRPVFDGDLGQLIGIDPGGLGGVATAISGLCTNQNYSYSDVVFEYNTVPVFSWTVEVITHELGHLMGSPHTHGCYWNGNNTAIDGCGTQQGYVEGSCTQGPIPDSTVGGTIMSYCHLVSGVGINLSNGFGPQPRARIQTAIANTACLSTDCVNTCINTVEQMEVLQADAQSVQLQWTDLTQSGPWNIRCYPYNTSPTDWISVNSATYSQSGLTPNTFYAFDIMPICANGLTSPIRHFMFVTAADYCAGVTLTDSGGATDNYGDMERYTRILMPNNPQQRLTLTFADFELEDTYDFLYLYNGSSTAAPEFLTGGYTGTNSPGTVTSTAVDGAITLRFFSDMYLNKRGYVAQSGCNDLLNPSFQSDLTDLKVFPNPATEDVFLQCNQVMIKAEVYQIDGRRVAELEGPNTLLRIDTQHLASGTYLIYVTTANKRLAVKWVRQ